jgi:hypothetical protein
MSERAARDLWYNFIALLMLPGMFTSYVLTSNRTPETVWYLLSPMIGFAAMLMLRGAIKHWVREAIEEHAGAGTTVRSVDAD